jgi:hypothetical protein
MPPNVEPALPPPRGRPPKPTSPLPSILRPKQSSPHSSLPSSKKVTFSSPPTRHSTRPHKNPSCQICQIFPLAKSWGDLCSMYDCFMIPPLYECDLCMNTAS